MRKPGASFEAAVSLAPRGRSERDAKRVGGCWRQLAPWISKTETGVALGSPNALQLSGLIESIPPLRLITAAREQRNAAASVILHPAWQQRAQRARQPHESKRHSAVHSAGLAPPAWRTSHNGGVVAREAVGHEAAAGRNSGGTSLIAAREVVGDLQFAQARACRRIPCYHHARRKHAAGCLGRWRTRLRDPPRRCADGRSACGSW